MIRRLRDILPIVLLLALLIGAAALTIRTNEDRGETGASSYARTDEGLLALYLWVDALGYDADRLEYRAFVPGETDHALLIINPIDPISADAAAATLDWVTAGGTLIFADDTPSFSSASRALLDGLDATIAVYTDTEIVTRSEPMQPVFTNPPVRSATVEAGRYLIVDDPAFVPIMGAAGEPVLGMIPRGAGIIFLASSAYPFSNIGLRDPENAALVQNLLRRLRPGERVLFDEYHQGRASAPATGARTADTIWGRAGLYALLTVAGFLLLSSRRLGPPIAATGASAARPATEYLSSVADLLRRGSKRAFVAAHEHQRLKRRLARPYAVNPALDDQDFVRELSRFQRYRESDLVAILARLRNPADEQALMHTVGEADAFAARFARFEE